MQSYNKSKSILTDSSIFQPPELKTNCTYGFFTDIYCCGVIFYCMLSGFYDDSQLYEISDIQEELEKDFFTDEAKDIIKKMIQADPIKRIRYEDIIEHSLIQKFKRDCINAYDDVYKMKIQKQPLTKSKLVTNTFQKQELLLNEES